MKSKLLLGDCRKVMADLDPNSIDTCITDPPYGLSMMSKKWDTFTKRKMRFVSPRLRESHGLYDFTVEWALEVHRVLKPGGVFLCFGGTRTLHRIACGIEDAGFELRDMVMWMHGMGFPKGCDISKGIDRLKGVKRKRTGRSYSGATNIGKKVDGKQGYAPGTAYPKVDTTVYETKPASPEATIWNGWNVALKPAWEPIIVAMKPVDGTFAENALKHGVAGLNVDGCRVDRGVPVGSWPANVILSHDPRCVKVGKTGTGPDRAPKDTKQSTTHDAPVKFGYSEERHQFDYGKETVDLYACVPGCPVRILDEQSGVSTSGKPTHARGKGAIFSRSEDGVPCGPQYGDRGSASRFFYIAKASVSERENGLMGQVSCGTCGKLSSKTHHVKVRGKIVQVRCRRNLHPTVKPVGLMRYLCKLTATPTGGEVLDPFMGTGTTGVACRLEGRDFVGIDSGAEEDSVRIAGLRIAAASQKHRTVKE